MKNMGNSEQIKVVFLDIDGTLLDSNDAHALSWKEALEHFKIDQPLERIRRLIGMGSDKLLPELTGIDAESDLGRRMNQIKGEIFKQKYLSNLKPFPQVRELLLKLKSQGLKLAAVSSAQKDELGHLLELAHVKDLVDTQISSDHVENSKPDPDLIALALRQMGVTPKEAVMLGDTPYDVEAAHKMGVRALAVESGGWSKSELKQADAIFKDAADLLHRIDTVMSKAA